MIEKYFSLPWQVRALMAWGSTLTGILVLFYIGRTDFLAAHAVEEQLFTFAGWGMAFWGPIVLFTMEGIRADS